MRSTVGALLGLGGLPAHTRQGLSVAFTTSVAVIMGVNLVYPVLPLLMQQLQVDEAAIGLVIAAYTLPSVFLTPIAGALADLHGRRPLLVGGLLLFGLAGAAVGLAPSFEWVLALRVLQGIGASAIMPLTIVLLSDLLQGEQETSAQGAKVIIDRIGTAILPLLAGILAALSWRAPFFLFALTVPLALLGLAWLPETRPLSAGGLRSYVRSFGGLGHRPKLLVAFSAGFLRFFLDYGTFTYLPVYLALARGTSPATVGLLLGCFAAGAMATASQAGRLVRGRDPAHLVFLGFALTGGAVLAIPFLPNDALVGLSLVVYGLGNGMISPLQKSVLTQNAPQDLRGGVISLDRLLQQIAKSVAPAAMGLLLLAADITAVFWALGLLSVAACALATAMLGLREGIRQPTPAS